MILLTIQILLVPMTDNPSLQLALLIPMLGAKRELTKL